MVCVLHLFQPKDLKEFEAPCVDKSTSPFSSFGLECVQSSLQATKPSSSAPLKKTTIIITPAKPPPCPKKLDRSLPVRPLDVQDHKEDNTAVAVEVTSEVVAIDAALPEANKEVKHYFFKVKMMKLWQISLQ